MVKQRFSVKGEAGAMMGEMAIVSMLLFSSLIAVCVMGVFMFKESLAKNAANDLLRVAEGKIGLWVLDPKGADREEYQEAFRELTEEFKTRINAGLNSVQLKSYVHEDGSIAPFAFLPPGQCARELGSGKLVCNSHMCGSLQGNFGEEGEESCQVEVCNGGSDGLYKVIPCNQLAYAAEHGFTLCGGGEERTGPLCERAYDADTTYHEKLENYPIEVRLTFAAMSWLKLPGTTGISRSALATGFPRLLAREDTSAQTPPMPPPNCYPWTEVKPACDTNCGPDYVETDTTRCDYDYCCEPRPQDSTRTCDRVPCCAPWTEILESCERACDGGHWLTHVWSCTPGVDEPCCDATRPDNRIEWCPGYPDWEVGDWGDCSAACGEQGTRTRNVACADVSCCGAEPERTEVCSGPPCPDCPKWEEQSCPDVQCAAGEKEVGREDYKLPQWLCQAGDGKCKDSDAGVCGNQAPEGDLACNKPKCEACNTSSYWEWEWPTCEGVECGVAAEKMKYAKCIGGNCCEPEPEGHMVECTGPCPVLPPWEEQVCPELKCKDGEEDVDSEWYGLPQWICKADDGKCQLDGDGNEPSGAIDCRKPVCASPWGACVAEDGECGDGIRSREVYYGRDEGKMPTEEKEYCYVPCCDGHWLAIGGCAHTPCDTTQTVIESHECVGGDCCEPKPADRVLTCNGPACENCGYIYQKWGGWDDNTDRLVEGRDEEPQCIADFLTNSRRCLSVAQSDVRTYLGFDSSEVWNSYYDGHGQEGLHVFDDCSYTNRVDWTNCTNDCTAKCAKVRPKKLRQACYQGCVSADKDCWHLEVNEVADFLGAPRPEGLPAMCSDHLMTMNTEASECAYTWYFDQDCQVLPGGAEKICGVFVEYMCPVSLVFSEDGSLVADGQVVQFKLDPTKDAEWSVWKAGEKAPLIVYDPEHKGQIDSAYRLFGNYAFGGKISSLKDARLLKADKPHKEPWKDGYEALGLLDKNGDGEISGSELEPVGLWFDKNRNGVSEVGEVVKVGEKGVTAIYYREGKKTDDAIVLEKGYRLEQSGATKIGKSVDWYGEVYRSQHDAQAALMNGVSSNVSTSELKLTSDIPGFRSTLGKSVNQTALPNLSGFWVWTILEKDGEKRPGVFAINDRGGKLTGWSIVDLPIKNKSGKTTTARTMMPLEGRVVRDEKGQQLLSLNVWNKEKTSVATSKVGVSPDGKLLQGSSEQRVQGEKGKVTTLKYDWVATKAANKK